MATVYNIENYLPLGFREWPQKSSVTEVGEVIIFTEAFIQTDG